MSQRLNIPRPCALLVALLALLPALHSRASDFEHAAVAADHPLASELGVAIMQQGGNALDAAVATGLAQGLMNPFASGMGGGGFALVFLEQEQRVLAFDFREVAPAAAHPGLFLREDGTVDRDAAFHGGLAVGVPGEVAGWWALHQAGGVLPWAEVLAPVITLAEEGFPVGSLLAERLASFSSYLDELPRFVETYQRDGRWLREGERLRRPDMADALRRIAEEGPAAFYEGEISDDIVNAVERAGGILTREDLAQYEVEQREPIVTPYAGHEVVGFPLPSSGGYVIRGVLLALQQFRVNAPNLATSAGVHLLTHTLQHLFATRALEMGSPLVVPDAVQTSWTSADAIAEITNTFRRDQTLASEAFGTLHPVADDAGTSHFSVVDAAGNAVACTTTINTVFGSLVMSERFGIVLNNEMNDFAASVGTQNAFGLMQGDANAVRAGHRPLSSMSPTLVLREGEVVGALGASGGPRIITATLQTLLRLFDGAETGVAIEASRFHHQWLPPELELDDDTSGEVRDGLEERGYDVIESRWQAAVQAIWRRDGAWDAAADSTKHGQAAGY